jgi:hypothetical protein
MKSESIIMRDATGADIDLLAGFLKQLLSGLISILHICNLKFHYVFGCIIYYYS